MQQLFDISQLDECKVNIRLAEFCTFVLDPKTTNAERSRSALCKRFRMDGKTVARYNTLLGELVLKTSHARQLEFDRAISHIGTIKRLDYAEIDSYDETPMPVARRRKSIYPLARSDPRGLAWHGAKHEEEALGAMLPLASSSVLALCHPARVGRGQMVYIGFHAK